MPIDLAHISSSRRSGGGARVKGLERVSEEVGNLAGARPLCGVERVAAEHRLADGHLFRVLREPDLLGDGREDALLDPGVDVVLGGLAAGLEFVPGFVTAD